MMLITSLNADGDYTVWVNADDKSIDNWQVGDRPTSGSTNQFENDVQQFWMPKESVPFSQLSPPKLTTYAAPWQPVPAVSVNSEPWNPQRNFAPHL